jgi:membrane-anchored protein YejM (alkaline phosphatase superfamily)
VLLEAVDKYLQRFPGEIPERRRTALAMISAVDDGIGRIVELLEEKGIYDRTLIIFTSDNGAPLGAHQKAPMADVLPVNKPGAVWDGSNFACCTLV